MKIHYIHQFYAGPSSPGPSQPRKLVEFLAERGHHVEVIACDFNAYNEQDEPSEDRGIGSGRIIVHRLKTPRGIRKSLKARLNSYGRFAWSAFRFAGTLDAPDVVMGTIQPLFGGVAGYRYARRIKRPFLLEIRDLWPDALVVKKAISPWQAAPLQHMAMTLYRHADRVVSLTPGIKTELLKKGISPARIDLFPNGFEEAVFNVLDGTRDRIRSKYGWQDKFVAVYTGTHTAVTAIDVIVRAAKILEAREDIRIDLFGGGQGKVDATDLAQRLKLKNIHFHDPVPKCEIPAILSGADAGVMTLFESPLIHIYFENKLIDYMGSAKPIAAAMGGVQADIIKREEAGIVAPGLDAEGLADAIRQIADSEDRGRKMGERGRAFVSSKLRQEDILTCYGETLEAVAEGRSDELPAWDPFGEGESVKR